MAILIFISVTISRENDYLYLNQHNGTFNDVSRAEMKHEANQYTMGVDVADLTNDGLPRL